MTLAFESVDRILYCDHSSKSSLPVLHMMLFVSHNFGKSNFRNWVEACLWPYLAVKGLIYGL